MQVGPSEELNIISILQGGLNKIDFQPSQWSKHYLKENKHFHKEI